jgi:hypothetical protein
MVTIGRYSLHQPNHGETRRFYILNFGSINTNNDNNMDTSSQPSTRR